MGWRAVLAGYTARQARGARGNYNYTVKKSCEGFVRADSSEIPTVRRVPVVARALSTRPAAVNHPLSHGPTDPPQPGARRAAAAPWRASAKKTGYRERASWVPKVGGGKRWQGGGVRHAQQPRWPPAGGPHKSVGHSGDLVSRDKVPATASTCTRHGFFSKSVISISALQSRARLLGAMVAGL